MLRYIIDELREIHGIDKVAVCASTGIAASHISGTTIHSFAGIGLGNGNLIEKVKKNPKCVARWRKTKVLIIDEISMLDGYLFNALEIIARELRQHKSSTSMPFGGIQLILCGDFFQLPPVQLQRNRFAFESPAWQLCNIQTQILTGNEHEQFDLFMTPHHPFSQQTNYPPRY